MEITTINTLTFDKYKYRSKKTNRLLMKFPFEMFASFIGLLKYSYRNDITSNHNRKSKDYYAALTIGRCGLGFKERILYSSFFKLFHLDQLDLS